LEKDPAQPNGPAKTSLIEIGPRFVLTPIRIFEGAFGGATVFSNPGMTFDFVLSLSSNHGTFFSEFVAPSAVRSALRRKAGDKYKSRKDSEAESKRRAELRQRDEDELAVSKVFS